MTHFFIDILYLLVLVSISIVVYIRVSKCTKINFKLFDILYKNIEILSSYYQKRNIINFNKSFELYSDFQNILKISKGDNISLFRYNYLKKYIELEFLFSIDKSNNINGNVLLNKIPISSNMLALDIIQSDLDLHSVNINVFKNENSQIYKNLKVKGFNQIYCQNIFTDNIKPFGFIVISYKDENYIINENDHFEILRIINNKIKNKLS